MAEPEKSVWQIVWDFCGHFSTGIWIVTGIAPVVSWLLSINPYLVGGGMSLLLALSVVSIVNRVKTSSEAPFLTLGDLRGSLVAATKTEDLRASNSKPAEIESRVAIATPAPVIPLDAYAPRLEIINTKSQPYLRRENGKTEVVIEVRNVSKTAITEFNVRFVEITLADGRVFHSVPLPEMYDRPPYRTESTINPGVPKFFRVFTYGGEDAPYSVKICTADERIGDALMRTGRLDLEIVASGNDTPRCRRCLEINSLNVPRHWFMHYEFRECPRDDLPDPFGR